MLQKLNDLLQDLEKQKPSPFSITNKIERLAIILKERIERLEIVCKKQLQEQCEHEFQYVDETYDRKQCTKCGLQRFK